MKKLADISAFERLGVQNTAADVSVFNFENTFKIEIDTPEMMDKVLTLVGCLGYDRIKQNPKFDLNVFYDYIRMWYDDMNEQDNVQTLVDELYDSGQLEEALFGSDDE